MFEKFILYGAGKVGDLNYQVLKNMGEADKIYAFCDKKADILNNKNGIPVISYKEAKSLGYPFIISVSDNSLVFEEIKGCLKRDEIEYYLNLKEYLQTKGYDMVRYNREFCATFHISDMDEYFDVAEAEENLNMFWGNDTEFLNLFNYLDLQNVVELACGRGRHVQKYMDKAGNITLVDILEKNIIYNKQRFSQYPNISFYKNNGYDLSELESNQYTSLFTYDAMVHFELMDIFNYLKETYRILTPGGYALFHHSNDSSDYKNSFEKTTNPHGRSFMDKNLFAYLAHRAGFQIVEQRIIDWYGCPDLDCITLVKK